MPLVGLFFILSMFWISAQNSNLRVTCSLSFSSVSLLGYLYRHRHLLSFFFAFCRILFIEPLSFLSHTSIHQSVAYLYSCTIGLYNSAMARPAAAQPWELVTTLFNNSSLRHTTTMLVGSSKYSILSRKRPSCFMVAQFTS